LISKINPASFTLRTAFDRLEEAFTSGSEKKILSRIRSSVQACQAMRPALLDKLRQHISIRAWMKKLTPEKVVPAMGEWSRKDAYFWRLFAKAHEEEKQMVQACFAWEEFRLHAVAQGWFTEESPEISSIYRHMIELLSCLSPRQLKIIQGNAGEMFQFLHQFYREQSPEIRAVFEKQRNPYFLDPGLVFERISRIDPDADLFDQWLQWLYKHKSKRKETEKVARLWRETEPSDLRPLLQLARLSEKRKAFTKAMGYINDAERIEKLNPEVRRMRMRVQLSTLQRHLQQRKPHLAEKDFIKLDALPELQQKGRSAFLTALKWVHFRLVENHSETQRCLQQVTEQMGNPYGGHLLLRAAAESCNVSYLFEKFFSAFKKPRKSRDGSTLIAVSKAFSIANDLYFPIELPDSWIKPLTRELLNGGFTVDPAHLFCFAEKALCWSDELAFAASGFGLKQGGPADAQFLFVRAQALPFEESERRIECLQAVIELAALQRNTELAAEAADLLREEEMDFGAGLDFFDIEEENGPFKSSMTQTQLQAVLLREKNELKRPKEVEGPYYDFDDVFPMEGADPLSDLLNEMGPESLVDFTDHCREQGIDFESKDTPGLPDIEKFVKILMELHDSEQKKGGKRRW
jgi:hypothetical protein